jgi:hypothetical protein
MAEMTLEMEQQLDRWEQKYLPVTNHINPDAAWAINDDDGMMFETYGEELAFVKAQPDQNVWTWVDGDAGTWLVNGFHLVNRIGYFITENPCEEELVEIQIDTYTNNEENN